MKCHHRKEREQTLTTCSVRCGVANFSWLGRTQTVLLLIVFAVCGSAEHSTPLMPPIRICIADKVPLYPICCAYCFIKSGWHTQTPSVNTLLSKALAGITYREAMTYYKWPSTLTRETSGLYMISTSVSSCLVILRGCRPEAYINQSKFY